MRGIAALAAAGVVRAIVTTNFDRLIERALEQHGVAYEVAYDDDGFAKLGQRLRDSSEDRPSHHQDSRLRKRAPLNG